MEQNNFEKNVRQKLDELKIPPSDAVWDNVEKKIGKKKRDRRLIFILFSLILVLLSGGYWLFNSTRNNSELPNHQLSSPFKNDSKATNNMDSSSAHTAISSGVIPGESGSPNVLQETVKVQSILIQNKKAGNVIKKKQKNTSAKIDFKENERIISSSGNEKENNKKSIDIEKENKTFDQNNLSETKPGIDIAKEKNNNSDSGIIVENKISADTLLKNKEEKLIAKADSSKKKIGEHQKKHKLSLGITFSVGKSPVGEEPFGTHNTSYVQSVPATGSASNPTVYSPSKIQGSFAFIGGVFIEKNISARSKISLGISYKYYSLLNKVGNRVDTSIAFPSQYFSSSGSLYNSINNANTYRNNFHYLEIPILLKLQLGKSKTLPVFWDAGINISQLISSNALQFTSNPGLYYHDNSLFNKTQIDLQTRFSAILFSNTRNPVSIGPYFIYNTSKLANEGLYGGKHFSFIGIKTEILFGKK